MLWLRRDIAIRHPYAIDRMLVATGLAKSLTEARRLIDGGAIYLNNQKLVAPEPGFLPVAVVGPVQLDEYVALGIPPEVAEQVLLDVDEPPLPHGGDPAR